MKTIMLWARVVSSAAAMAVRALTGTSAVARTRLSLLLVAGLLLPSCTTTSPSPRANVAVTTPPVRELPVRSVRVDDRGSSIRVNVRVGGRSFGSYRVRSRIRIEALKDGQLVAGRDVHFYSIVRRRMARSATYRTEFAFPASAVDEIRISRIARKARTAPAEGPNS